LFSRKETIVMFEKLKNLFKASKKTECPFTDLADDQKLPVVELEDDVTVIAMDELCDGREEGE
jgi:hypothetical protein